MGEDMIPYCESDYYLKVKPEKGLGILFFSYRPDYSMDEYAIHGACPVKRGYKGLFQRWMRFESNSLYEKQPLQNQENRTLWGKDRLLRPGEAETSTPAPAVLGQRLTLGPSAQRAPDPREILPPRGAPNASVLPPTEL